MRRLLSFALMLSTIVTGCKVGPDYYPPVTEVPVAFSEDEAGRTFEPDDEDLVEWWRVFNDPCLDELLEEASNRNFDYRIALEQVCQARSQYWFQFTQILPEFIGDGQASRYRVSRSFRDFEVNPATAALSPIRNFFQVGFDAIWEIDIFGGLRRAAAAAYDSWEATIEEARAVKIIVLSEVANTYVAIRSFQNKSGILAERVKLDEELHTLSKERFEAGLTNEQEVLAAFEALETDRANLLVYETGLMINIYSLAVLLDRLPETLPPRFECVRPVPFAMEMIPVGLPSDLLRRRPDIANAERNLAAATEQIGVAVAELYPKISLTGSSSSFAANPLQGANVGWSSDQASKLFNSASRVWGIGALVTFPVFDWGMRCAQVHVQESLAQQAYLTYQKTVIAALQEVEQSLATYFNDEQREIALLRSSEAYKREYDLAADLYQSGLADYSQMLQAKEAWLNALDILTDAQANLATDTIAIYKALGGEWQCY